MRYVVFSCKKCGGQIYLENEDGLFEKLKKLSNYDCPFCGEEPDELWILTKFAKTCPTDTKEETDENND